MKLFAKKDKPPKDTKSVEFKRYMAAKLNGRSIRYVLQRLLRSQGLHRLEERLKPEEGNGFGDVADSLPTIHPPQPLIAAIGVLHLPDVPVDACLIAIEREAEALIVELHGWDEVCQAIGEAVEEGEVPSSERESEAVGELRRDRCLAFPVLPELRDV